MKRYYGYMKKYWKEVVLCNFLLCICIGVELVLPQISGSAINYITITTQFNPGTKPELWLYVLAFLCLSALSNVLGRTRGILSSKVSSSIIKDLRCVVYEKLQSLHFDFHNNMPSGQIISRVTHDINIMRQFFDVILFLILEIFSYILGASVLLLLIHAKLALVALSTLPVTLYMMIKARKNLRVLWRKADDDYGEMTKVMQENITGVKVVKSFATEEKEIMKFNEKAKAFFNSIVNGWAYWVTKIPFIEFVFGLSVPITLWYGGTLVINNQINIGDLTKVFFYLMGLGWRIDRIGQIVNTLENSNAAASRISEILDVKPEIIEKEIPVIPDKTSGNIVFENVSFSYKKGTAVLKDINFAVQAGEIVGIIGPTGSGKSTLLNLIPRFYDYYSGRILIDNTDIRDMKLSELRKMLGIAFQEPFLFSTTISDNISYGCHDISAGEVKEIAADCASCDFIEKLLNKYDTVVGDRGVTLSGGQKQRITIARALAVKPKIFIFDNPTSSLDSETERHIIQKLVNLGTTTIIISQKINVLRHAQRIIVIENGSVTAEGPHEKLILQPGFYKKIYEEQMLDVSTIQGR